MSYSIQEKYWEEDFLEMWRMGRKKPYPLVYAAESNDLETVRQLLKDGADVHERGALGETALHMAVALSNTEMMESEWSRNPATPLHYAIEYCDDDNDSRNTIIKLLVDAGADPYATPHAPLNFACRQKDHAQLTHQIRPLPCPPPDGNRILYDVVYGLGLSTDAQGHLDLLKA
ncbi:Transient receptor putative cation channel sub V member 5, partial [Borealophlyctis nickersoniae]